MEGLARDRAPKQEAAGRPTRRDRAVGGVPRALQDGSHIPAIVVGALEAARVAGVLCRRDGTVLAHTRSAERLLTTGVGLQVRAGRLAIDDAGVRERLRRAVAAAGAGRPQRLTLTSGEAGAEPLTAHVDGLGAAGEAFGELVLVSLSGKPAPDLEPWRQAFGFTAREAEVAAALLAGLSPKEIAASRAVSVETVRSQLKAIYQKTGVNRLSRLMALLWRHA